jgi:acyl carrier protein
MTNEEIIVEIRQLLSLNKCRVDNVNLATEIDKLGLDSVRLTAVLMDLEDHFLLVIPDEIWSKWKRLSEIADYISLNQNILTTGEPEEPDQQPEF